MLSYQIVGNSSSPESVRAIRDGFLRILDEAAAGNSHVVLSCYDEIQRLEPARSPVRLGKMTIVVEVNGGSGEVDVRIVEQNCCG